MICDALPQFPLLFPIPNSNGYEGFLTIEDEEFLFSVQQLFKDSLTNCSIYSSPELKDLLMTHKSFIQEKMIQCKTISEFLVELKELIRKKMIANKYSGHSSLKKDQEKTFDYLSLLVQEITDLRPGLFKSIDKEFSKLELLFIDENSRKHEVTFIIPPSYPYEAPQVISDLPVAVNLEDELFNKLPQDESILSFHSSGKKFTLDDAVKYVDALLHILNPFFNFFDEIDSSAIVIDPLKPQRSCNYRRILIDSRISLSFSLDPMNLATPPTFSFFGPEDEIQQKEELLRKYIARWDSSQSFLSNLESALGSPIPRRNVQKTVREEINEDDDSEFSLSDDEEIETEEKQKKEKNAKEDEQLDLELEIDLDACCGICYNLHPDTDPNLFPNVFCQNEQCKKGYHSVCIIQWFQTQPSTRQSFKTLFGNCPYCQNQMTVTID